MKIRYMTDIMGSNGRCRYKCKSFPSMQLALEFIKAHSITHWTFVH